MARRRPPSKRPSRRRSAAGGRLALALVLATLLAVTGWVLRLVLAPGPTPPPPARQQQPAPPAAAAIPAPRPQIRQPVAPPPEPPAVPSIPHGPPVSPPEPLPAPPHDAGQLVIVIDDLGQELLPAHTLASLGIPVVFSILPSAPKAEATARLAQEAGLDVLVHLPCEPKGFPRANPGPGALMAGMDPDRIRALVDAALDRLPGAMGANNHMGSRFTEDLAGVTAMLEALHRRGKLFLDSATTPRSAVPAACRALGLPYLRRAVFLDTVASTPAVLAQLRKAETIAQKRGVAIAIGHPHAATLRALAIWARERQGPVQLVSLGQIAPRLLAHDAAARAPSGP